jgi:hypothetical protein
VIDDTKNPQALYRLNDKLPDESRIVKVEHNHIVLKSPDGTKTELYITPGAGSGSASAAPAAPRPAAQPTPERSIVPAQGQSTPSAGSGADSGANRLPPRMDRLDPNKQHDPVRDPNKIRRAGRGGRSRPGAVEEN